MVLLGFGIACLILIWFFFPYFIFIHEVLTYAACICVITLCFNYSNIWIVGWGAILFTIVWFFWGVVFLFNFFELWKNTTLILSYFLL